MERELLKKGDKVVMHTCIEAETHNGRVWTCKTDEYIKGEGVYKQNLVFLEGFSGCFSTEFLQKITIEKAESKLCPDCGEPLTCPKCTPIIEKTNSLIIRYKDTDYNGGYPNALIIAPLYTSENKSFSVATVTGDNFYWDKNRSAGFTYIERGTVESAAETLANLNLETWSRLFGFPKNRIRFADDIKKELVKYLNKDI